MWIHTVIKEQKSPEKFSIKRTQLYIIRARTHSKTEYKENICTLCSAEQHSSRWENVL